MARSRSILTRRKLLGGLAAAVGACAAGSIRSAAQIAGVGKPRPVEVNASALKHFHRLQPGVRRFGDLEYRGGLVLTSPSASFREWSGLIMDADGRRLLAVSDAGSSMSADVAYSEDGAPAGLARAVVASLLDAQGGALTDKDDRNEQDAESIALVDGSLESGTVLIGFERKNRIERCEVRGGQVQAPSGVLPMPPEAGRFLSNRGFEAVAVLPAGPLKGSPVAFAERFISEGYHAGWIWSDGPPRPIQLQFTDGFEITDAAGLPDGGLLILERAYDEHASPPRNKLRMRIRRLESSEIEPGARLAGRTVMQADADCEIDNMEGLAVHRGAQGETVVSLISDDNGNSSRQRTVFLQFVLLE